MVETSSFERIAAMMVLLTDGTRVGRTALNNLLWFADMAHLLTAGRTISGTTYRRSQFGPAPTNIDAIRLQLLQRVLLTEHVTESECYQTFFYEANVAHIDYGILQNSFDESEWSVLMAVKDKLGGQPGAYLHEMSHRFEPWSSARPEEDLDLNRAKADTKFHQWMEQQCLIPGV